MFFDSITKSKIFIISSLFKSISLVYNITLKIKKLLKFSSKIKYPLSVRHWAFHFTLLKFNYLLNFDFIILIILSQDFPSPYGLVACAILLYSSSLFINSFAIL